MKKSALLFALLGLCLVAQEGCPAADQGGDGWSPDDGDCHDTNPELHPGAVERCNELDDNCNGSLDEGDPHPDNRGHQDRHRPHHRSHHRCRCSSLSHRG